MIKSRNEGVIIEKSDLAFERQAVLNPAYIEVDGVGHLFYRAVSDENVSTIGYCQLKGNKVVKRLTHPLLVPEHDYEKQGLEDPRIVCLGGTYYLFYTAFDGKNAVVAYATSTDLVSFEKHGVISPRINYQEVMNSLHDFEKRALYRSFAESTAQMRGTDVFLWEKDSFIFPKKIGGRYALVHRVLPGIQIIYFDNFSDLVDKYWQDYFPSFSKSILLEPEQEDEIFIGGGCPPIETPDGWLLIYHTVTKKNGEKVYSASAALLDLNDPHKVLGRLNDPLFSPEETWELVGMVNNVVFPTGATVRNGRLYIFYGAADQVIASRSFDLAELITELKKR